MDSSANLIVAAKKAEDLRFAEAVAARAKIPLKTFDSMSNAVNEMGDDSILILDLDILDNIKPPNLPLNSVHLMTTGADFGVHSKYFGEAPYGHFILRKVPENAESDGDLYGRVIAASLNPGRTGLEPAGFNKEKIEILNFTGQVQKKFAATSTSYFLMENGFNEQSSTNIGAAVDELIMNAMVDAANEGNLTFFSDKVQLEASLDGDVFGVSVRDPHGSLDRIKLFRHLRTNFAESLNEVRVAENRGAGLGLTQILRSGGSLLFNVIPKKRTEVSLIYRRAINSRTAKKQVQFISSLQFNILKE